MCNFFDLEDTMSVRDMISPTLFIHGDIFYRVSTEEYLCTEFSTWENKYYIFYKEARENKNYMNSTRKNTVLDFLHKRAWKTSILDST